MTALDLLITIGILVLFLLIIYLKMTKKTVKDLMLEIRDIIKSMREK